MRIKATFLLGLSTGYVLGAKAGRERYDAIARTARRAWENPSVQETAGVLQAQAVGVIANVRRALTSAFHDKLSQLPGHLRGNGPSEIRLPEPTYAHNGHTG